PQLRHQLQAVAVETPQTPVRAEFQAVVALIGSRLLVQRPMRCGQGSQGGTQARRLEGLWQGLGHGSHGASGFRGRCPIFSCRGRRGKLGAFSRCPPIMSPRRKTLLSSLLAVLCLAMLLASYGWFQTRYIRPFEARTELFAGSQLRLPAELAGPGPIRLVHFWDPACPCNVGNQQHLGELLQAYAPRGVQFYVVQKAGSQGRLPDTLQALQPLEALAGSADLPASPAVAIWDAQG